MSGACGPATVVGIDVGGTFTDILVLDERTGRARTAKVPSTRTREAAGFLRGLRSVVAPADVAAIVHGTTVATNALLERKGAPCGVITTRGFRDVLEMRRRDRPTTWGMRGDFVPVVPRDLRVEVDERVGADGEVVVPVDPAEVAAAARELRGRGAQALVIAFINAYANDANEQAAARAVDWPEELVTVSSALLAEIREFERTSTAALNGYLQPVVGPYLRRLEDDLAADGFAGRFLVVQSNGGVVPADEARRFPVRTALSGPAAGVVAAARTAADAGIGDVITCDMGGTSFDVALVAGGAAAFAQQAAIEFGLVIRTPMVEITTIGAGGGSIAHVDAGGLLRIGPESAGSVPGPAAYGLGNDRPTVTDANVVLGRIDAEHPLGEGLGRLDVDAARAALAAHVGAPLGLGVEAAAQAVIDVANARMAGAIRLISIQRGHDPTRFSLMPFGGAGALHVGALLREVGCPQALVPPLPGITSALGCVLADLRHDYVHTLNVALEALDGAALAAEMAATARRGTEALSATGVALEGIDVLFEVDMLYRGQSHAVAVPVTLPGGGAAVAGADVAAAFDRRYEEAYGQTLAGVPVLLQTLRTAVVGRRPRVDLSGFRPPDGATADAARRATRPVWTDGRWQDTPVYDRLALPAGARLEGPAVLQQPDTTILVEPGSTATVDALGNLLIEVARA
ncbi:hydantoinase/oxoprolinase family protein [Baekduia soli]|uniref:Hydantoinase/oxoprolinase family protein n=1 Tax=Baekduia soli TaxID=496014 RepID=A0A5B8TZH6_9ACTN|nr:hydantoinase/oxoprolinase family protein [Baekduia soli]QEC46127.1 hydantoinase/oxoprolinase family protein [Baekduia soli]